MDRIETMERLKRRTEFLAVAGGTKAPRRGFVLQRGRIQRAGAARFGFTVTKKTGNSPERNRIRRRLREVVRLAAPDHAEPGFDYVLIGRRAALTTPFPSLIGDLISGLDALRSGTERRASSAPRGTPQSARTAAGPSAPTPRDASDDR